MLKGLQKARAQLDKVIEQAIDVPEGELVLGELHAAALILRYAERFLEEVQNEAKEIKTSGTTR